MTKPTLVFHADHPFKIAKPLFRVLSECGLAVTRGGYQLDELINASQTHLVWGMAHNVEVYRELAKHDNVFFMENGWFTQSSGCYIDKQGPNALSSIRASLDDACLRDDVANETFEFLSRLHQRVGVKIPSTDEPYLFVSLQVEKDTQLLYWSGCDAEYPDRQVWFIHQICQAFADTRIVIRPHPRDLETANRIMAQSQGYRKHSNISFQSGGTSYDWIAGAKGVLGINSTVLLEALSLHKPVCAMGEGLFTDNGVMWECRGDPKRLEGFRSYQPDRSRITRFLNLLLQRQIPYRLKRRDVDRHSVLTQLFECAGVTCVSL